MRHPQITPDMSPVQMDRLRYAAEREVPRLLSTIDRLADDPQRSDTVEVLRSELAAAEAVVAEVARIHADRPWRRYRVSRGGTLHQVHCPRQASWSYEDTGLAGADEVTLAVRSKGSVCRHCLPDVAGGAAVRAASAAEAMDKAARAESRAARAEQRRAHAEATGISAADGGTLVDQSGWPILTQATAWVRLVDALCHLEWYTHSRDEYQAAVYRISAALAARTGTTADEVLATAEGKRARRAKRQAAGR